MDESIDLVVTTDYGVASAIAFYANVPVVCEDHGERRMNQYDLWYEEAEQFRGEKVLLVLKEPRLSEGLRGRFTNVEMQDSALDIFFSGEKLRSFYFFSADEYTPAASQVWSRF